MNAMLTGLKPRLAASAAKNAEAYRGRNLEICNLNDTLHGLGGLLIEPAPPET